MDTHYSYKPDTVAWVIHEHLPDLPVADVERLAEAIEGADLQTSARLERAYEEGRNTGIDEAVGALGAL